jgi:AcrR family transcriptional regulator
MIGLLKFVYNICLGYILTSVGRPAQTSRAEILDAALALADQAGLEAVTMQAVAGRLGVTPMALYRHVDGKADLLDGLVELLLTRLPHPPGDLAWPDRLAGLAHGLRAAAARHPAVFPLLLQRPARTAAAVEVRDAARAALVDAGLAPADAERAERLMSTAVLGFAASEAAGRFAHHEPDVLDADFDCLLDALVAAVRVRADRAPEYAARHASR